MKHHLLLALVVLAGIVPFSSRAVYMDEHIFLLMARSAHTNFLFPQDTPALFFGQTRPSFVGHTHPPVGEYYLALLYSIFGEFREVPFRLLFSVFAIAAVFGFYALAKRFTANPLWLSLLFAVSPAFFVYSATLMMDVPMLACLLAGFALYFGHVQGRRGFLPLSSMCFILAVGIGYTALVPLGCFFAGLLAARRPLKELLSVVAAPVALTLYLVAMTIHFGAFPPALTLGYLVTQGSVFRNVLALLSFTGATGVFPWLVSGKRLPITTSVLAVAILTLFTSWPSMVYRLWFIVLASSGLVVLITFAGAARKLIISGKNTGEAFLILWVPATLLFFVLIGDMISARYILLALPALYLVIFRDASERRLIYITVPTAVLSLTLAYADFISVNVNRDWVQQTVVPLQQEGFRIWSGAESGLRFYLEQKGIQTLSATDVSPKPGDLIVRHKLYHYGLADSVGALSIILKTFTLTSAFPVRTYNQAAGAGFHDSNMGLVPFIFSRAAFDEVEVAEMCPLEAAVWSPEGPIFMQREAEREFPMKIPSNTKIEYELDGDGAAAVMTSGIRLIKGPAPRIVWRNFRIVPKQFALQ